MPTNRAAARLILRLAGAGLSAAMAAIHLSLWAEGYRDLATIGLLFLLNGVVGILHRLRCPPEISGGPRICAWPARPTRPTLKSQRDTGSW
ncbi:MULTISPECIES: hypothetical protein [Streptomyces]|uniref:hypothetical protein n=1 Tax=Streptomyces TaxID=1883 RepID=UPI000A4A1E48|nr:MULTISPECIES: hypothetical protein [Streptomyces]MDI5911889.1 hypothetical protein [Streptomyces sp. 12257]